MKQVIIIHGWKNDSQGNWFPWLKTELEKQGYKVKTPDFPNPEFPNLIEWINTLNEAVKGDEKETILIGHSLGSVTILRYLQSLSEEKEIKAAILVAGFITADVNIDSKEVVSFVSPLWNWKKIQKSSKKFYVINSDNDRYIPLSDAKLLAKNLNQKLIIKKGQDHFNLKSSPKFTKLPFLPKLIDQIEKG